MSDTIGRVPAAAAPLRWPFPVPGRRAVLWLPVAMGFGIWVYFALPREPPLWSAGIVLLPLLWLAGGGGRSLGGLAAGLAVLAVAAGFALSVAAAARVAAPVLARPVQENVEGRVVALSRSASGAPRVLLDRVVMHGLDPAETPGRVRVTLLAAERETAPRPGERVLVYARLSPPGGPVEPGAFDFRLRAWFEGLGAIGYARTPPVRLPGHPSAGWRDRLALRLAASRLGLADALRHAIPGPEGAFAAAIVTGDRSGIRPEDAEALRLSNLAHLLAISGLHMGILTGLIFAGVRLVLAPLPGVARRISARKLAAVAALAGGAAYLAASGATVATQRAFVMVAVAFVAVLIDRPAISLRALAVAAVIVLAIRPVSLLDVGFQMSFAATTALVAGYEMLRERRRGRPRRERGGPAERVLTTLLLYAAGVLFTSVLAGLATAPYAAYHFNRTAPWGLLANLAAVPAMGLAIAPAAIAAGIAAPIGLEAPALWLMAQGIGWVLGVADWVAALPGAGHAVPAAGAHVLPLVTLGGLWLCLTRGALRLSGAAAVVLALFTWTAGSTRPDLLIAPEARLLGLAGPQGRALDTGRGQRFAAEIWLRRDGDGADPAVAGERPGLERGRGRASGTLSNGWRVELLRARHPDEALIAELCRPRVLLVARSGWPHSGPCRYVGWRDLRRMGAIAVHVDGDDIRLRPSRHPGRSRPWEGD